MDDTTLLVDLGIFEQQVVAPVVEHQQTRVDDTLALERCRTDVIYSLVDRGIGIEIGTKLNADSLAPGHDAQALALAREVLGTIKCHMLEEVSQTALTGLLLYRSHTLGNIEIGQTCLLSVVADIVGHAILELTLADGGVLWQALGHCRYRQQRQSQKRTNFLHYLQFFNFSILLNERSWCLGSEVVSRVVCVDILAVGILLADNRLVESGLVLIHLTAICPTGIDACIENIPLAN